MEAVVKGFVVLITNLNLEFFEPYIFMVERRSHNFLKRNLELEHTQDIGVLAYNFNGGKNGIFIEM
jgi:hypothetical protein